MQQSTPVDFKPAKFQPGAFGGNQTDRMYGQVVEGPHSYEGSGMTNIRPFWISPLQLLPHNVYTSSKIPVADKGTYQANILGLLAVMMASYGLGGLKGLSYLGAGWAGMWLLWLADFPQGFRECLTSPELAINV